MSNTATAELALQVNVNMHYDRVPLSEQLLTAMRAVIAQSYDSGGGHVYSLHGFLITRYDSHGRWLVKRPEQDGRIIVYLDEWIDFAYHNGHDDGHRKGYEGGYNVGHQDGRSKGFRDGTHEGEKAGFTAGKRAGLDEGYAKGKEDGQREGYEKGESDGFGKGQRYGLNLGDQQGFDRGHKVGHLAGHKQGQADVIDLLRSQLEATQQRMSAGAFPVTPKEQA